MIRKGINRIDTWESLRASITGAHLPPARIVRIKYPRQTSSQQPYMVAMSVRPVLRAERDDGSEDDIKEADLYRFTRYRWIYNEKRELAKRYLKFDLEKLIDAAIQATGKTSTHCYKVLKCKEGLHNKVLLLTMDDGTEVIAKLPSPNAGPSYLTTESEVATREFLREVLKIPVPKIYGWSSDKSNPVGAEYILEEKAPGRPLGSLWHQMPRKSKLDIISQVAELESRLASMTFNRHGCIYFQNALKAGTVPLITDPPISSDMANRFALGPITAAELWNSEVEGLKLDRGPWETPLAYFKAAGNNEMAGVRAFARPRKSPHHATEDPELPEDFILLLEDYLKITPHLVPSGNDMEICLSTLWHPDLHRDNVFVDPDTNKITRIIDWQSAIVAPLFLQFSIPRMVRHSKPVDEDWAVPERPADYDGLSTDEKARLDADIESLTYHKYYRYQSLKRNPRHWACLEQQNKLELLTRPVKLITGAWKNDDVFYFREALMALVEHWDEFGNGWPCPISFSEEVYRVHA